MSEEDEEVEAEAEAEVDDWSTAWYVPETAAQQPMAVMVDEWVVLYIVAQLLKELSVLLMLG